MRILVASILLAASVVCMGSIVFADMPKDEYVDEMKALRDRFSSYMTLRKSSDFNGMYEMFSANYRKQRSLEDFKRMPFETTMNLLAFYVEAIHLKGEEATIHLMEYSIAPGLPTARVQNNIVQNWIKESGEWFYDRDPTVKEVDFSACGEVARPELPDSPPTVPACGNTRSGDVKTKHGKESSESGAKAACGK